MNTLLSKPWIKAYSGLSVNISAAWFGLTFIGVTFSVPSTESQVFSLFRNLALGVIFLLICVWCENRLIEDE